MRAATAYFVGAGTIIAAIAIGLGGGLVAGNIMNPVAPKKGAEATKVERRAAPVAATNAPSEPIQYLTGTQAFSAVAAAAPAQAKDDSATAPAAQPAQTATNVSKPAEAKSAEAKTAPRAKPAEQASSEPASSPEDAYAKAKDSDVKRATSERRHADRRQRWAERRRYEARDRTDRSDGRDRSDWNRDRTDWNDVARNVHEDAEARELPARPHWGFPQMRLFGSDDDD